MSVNRCTFKGFLGGDVDLRFLPDGTPVGNLSIACSERWKDKQSNEIKERTEWARLVVFGKRAEVINEYFKKGSEIYVETKMRTRKWEKDGITHYSTEFVIENFDFCGTRNGGDSGNARAQQQASAYSPNSQSESGGNNPPQHNAPPPDYDDQFDDDTIPF
jgi:single-strand DNA-binding protein